MMKGLLLLTVAMCLVAPGAAASAAAPEERTVITGEQMDLMRSGRRVVFSGGAEVNRGTSVLNADKIVQDKENNRVEAEGRIRFKSYTADNELVLGTAGRAWYSPDEERGELWGGRPEVRYYQKTSTGPLTLRADRISFDQKKEEMLARGDVEIVSSSGCARAPEALFRQKDKKVFLTGAPVRPEVVYVKDRDISRYSADRITFLLNERKARLEGNVHGRIESEELDRRAR